MTTADLHWQEIVAYKKVGTLGLSFEMSKRMVDVNTLKQKDAREIGTDLFVK